jgi:hypothetical protein
MRELISTATKSLQTGAQDGSQSVVPRTAATPWQISHNIMRTTNNSSTRTTSYRQTLAENSQWAESGYSSQSLEQFLNKVPTISHQFLQIPERRCVNNLSTVHLFVSFPRLEKEREEEDCKLLQRNCKMERRRRICPKLL